VIHQFPITRGELRSLTLGTSETGTALGNYRHPTPADQIGARLNPEFLRAFITSARFRGRAAGGHEAVGGGEIGAGRASNLHALALNCCHLRSRTTRLPTVFPRGHHGSLDVKEGHCQRCRHVACGVSAWNDGKVGHRGLSAYPVPRIPNPGAVGSNPAGDTSTLTLPFSGSKTKH
jgi:hypothetical protein